MKTKIIYAGGGFVAGFLVMAKGVAMLLDREYPEVARDMQRRYKWGRK